MEVPGLDLHSRVVFVLSIAYVFSQVTAALADWQLARFAKIPERLGLNTSNVPDLFTVTAFLCDENGCFG